MSGQQEVSKHRVRLTHTVEESGALQDVEIPFTMGVITDGRGNHPDADSSSLDDSEFVEVNSGSFDRYLEKCNPRMLISVPNRLGDDPDEELVADIDIRSMTDFTPDAIAQKVPGLREVYEARNRLENLLRHMENSRSAKKVLDQVLAGVTAEGTVGDAAGGEG